MGSRIWHFYDIVYKNELIAKLKRLPRELFIDLEKYGWYSTIERGMGHLNAAARKAIKEETKHTSIYCKVKVLNKNTLEPLDTE